MQNKPLIIVEAKPTDNFSFLNYLLSRKEYVTVNVEYDYSRLDYDIPKVDLEKHDHLSMCFGSINFIKKINRTTPYQFMAEFDIYKPSVYGNILRDDFLNYDGVFLPYGYLKRQDKIKMLQNILGTDEIFVKCDAGDKKIPGHLIDYKIREILNQSYLTMPVFYTDSSDRAENSYICLCAKKKVIKREWRLVVSSANLPTVFASTLYIENNAINHGPCPLIVKDYARGVLSKIAGHYIDPIFVMDICELEDGTLKVLELNAFSTSGFYGCDPMEIDDALVSWFTYCRNV